MFIPRVLVSHRIQHDWGQGKCEYLPSNSKFGGLPIAILDDCGGQELIVE